MGTGTFQRIDPSRRSAILHAAFSEFAATGYEAASLNAIIQAAGIPKGSLYQYFGSKKDLYLHLMQVAQGRRMEYLQDVLDRDGLTFWDLVAELFEADFRFELENPLQARFLAQAAAEERHPDFGNLRREWIETQSNALIYVLEKEKARGKIRERIHTRTLAWLLARMQTSSVELLEYRFGISLDTPSEVPMFGIPKKEIRNLAKDLTRILKSGIRN
jgi:AcrR family transcriptional regulator